MPTRPAAGHRREQVSYRIRASGVAGQDLPPAEASGASTPRPPQTVIHPNRRKGERLPSAAAELVTPPRKECTMPQNDTTPRDRDRDFDDDLSVMEEPYEQVDDLTDSDTMDLGDLGDALTDDWPSVAGDR
jgi:hypothetical protein